MYKLSSSIIDDGLEIDKVDNYGELLLSGRFIYDIIRIHFYIINIFHCLY